VKEIFCCGTGQRTPYCSMCGKRLQSYPLSDLLNHCREQAEKAEDKFKKLVNAGLNRLPTADDNLGREMCARLGVTVHRPTFGQSAPNGSVLKEYRKLRDDAHKWRSYADALERIMRHVSTMPPEDSPDGDRPQAPQGDGRTLEL